MMGSARAPSLFCAAAMLCMTAASAALPGQLPSCRK